MSTAKTSEERKQNSEKVLASLGITLTNTLPAIQEEESVELRSASEVARRILILTYLNCMASEPSLRQEVMRFLIFEKLWDSASSEEKSLFHKDPLSDEEIDSIYWKVESIALLLWAIKKIDVLQLPEKEIDLRAVFPLSPTFFEPTSEFIEKATLRDVSAILDRYDLMLRLNWALRQGDVSLEAKEINPDVAFEQYHALSWIIKENNSN